MIPIVMLVFVIVLMLLFILFVFLQKTGTQRNEEFIGLKIKRTNNHEGFFIFCHTLDKK